MATTKKTDPLAGIPVGAVKTARPRVATPAPVNIATARAARKRRKLTGTEYKQVRDQARTMTGYDSSSPIWGQKAIDVLTSIETILTNAQTELSAGYPSTASAEIEAALGLNKELQKRLATQTLISLQTKP